MAYEFLKKLFGEPKDGEQPKAMTYAELESAIDADKDLALYNLNDGGYVAKAKLDAKIAELKGTQKQLEDANAAIKGFEGQDVDGIKKQVEDWQKKYDTDTKALQEQIAASNRAHAEEMFLSGYQFTSKAARNGVLAEVRAKNFAVENGTLLGGKEFMSSLMEQEDYKGAFVSEKSNEGEQETPPPANQPRFAAGTNGSAGTDGSAAPKFDFGFAKIRD